MSKGIVHNRACLGLAVGFTVGTLFTHNPADLQYAIGAAAGVFLSPDLDVDAKNLSYHIIGKVCAIPEKVWSAVWFMYRRSLKHGGELSHFPVVSTLGRLANIFFFAIIVPYLLISTVISFSWTSELGWWLALFAKYWRVVCGLMAADTIHYILDIVTVNDTFNINSLLHGKTNYHKRRLK